MVAGREGRKEGSLCLGDGKGAGDGRREGSHGRGFVGWLLNVPATCFYISGRGLLSQVYVLPH